MPFSFKIQNPGQITQFEAKNAQKSSTLFFFLSNWCGNLKRNIKMFYKAVCLDLMVGNENLFQKGNECLLNSRQKLRSLV